MIEQRTSRPALALFIALASVPVGAGCKGDDKPTPASSTAAAAPAKASPGAGATTMSAVEMTKEARKKGRPFVPDGWKPKPGERVVKEISNWGIFDMYEITRLAGGKAHVKYCGTGDEQKAPMAVEPFAPLAAKDSKAMPAEGAFVIIPEKDASSCKWQFARVKKVAGRNVTVETVNFQKQSEKTEIQERMVRPGEFVLVK